MITEIKHFELCKAEERIIPKCLVDRIILILIYLEISQFTWGNISRNVLILI